MINTYIPFFQKKDQEILKKCLKTNYVSTAGPLVSKFEKVFQKKYRFENCLALNSGTSALHVALKSIGVKEGDTVIMPSYTFAATANAVIYIKAQPWFFDCDENFNLSIENIEKILESETVIRKNNLILKKNNSIVRAIIPVSTFGKKLEFFKLFKLGKKYKLKVLFDTAACHDPKIFNFKKKIDMNFCFSFNGNKTITTGAGGIFASNSKNIIEKARTLANVGKKIKKYDYDEIGFNYKMTNIQAALGICQLSNLGKILILKKKIFNFYYENLKKFVDTKLVYDKQNQNWVFVIKAKSIKKFKEIQKLFHKSKIQLDFFWKPLHLQKPYTRFMKEELKQTEYIWNKIIVLPSHPGIKIKEQIRIINILKKVL